MNKPLEALKKITISHETMAYQFNHYLDKDDENYMICINENWEEELNLIEKVLKEYEAYEKKVKRYIELVDRHKITAPYHVIKNLEELDKLKQELKGE